MPISDDVLRSRAVRMLMELDMRGPELVEAVVALLDDTIPSRITAMASKGFGFSAGATTAQLFAEIAPLLGKARIDREQRDYVMLPLREVGVLRIRYWDSDADEIVDDWWKPKSQNNLYAVQPDVASMLRLDSEAAFNEQLADWLSTSAARRTRHLNAEAAAAAAKAPGRFVAVTIERYCNVFLPGWEVVFVDDADGERIGREYRSRVEELNLPLGLATRWSDVILYSEPHGFWIVDCVTSDGEIDLIRWDELRASFAARGLQIAGMTTAYETFALFASRQRRMRNIAPDTFIWILEEAGSQLFKRALDG